MKLEDQVITLELGKKLKELGVLQCSEFYHIDNTVLGYEGIKQRPYVKNIHDGIPIDAGVVRYYSAYSVAELGVLIPGSIDECRLYQWAITNDKNDIYSYGTQYRFKQGDLNYGTIPHGVIFGDTEAIVRAKLLISILGLGKVSADECNKRLTK